MHTSGVSDSGNVYAQYAQSTSCRPCEAPRHGRHGDDGEHGHRGHVGKGGGGERLVDAVFKALVQIGLGGPKANGSEAAGAASNGTAGTSGTEPKTGGTTTGGAGSATTGSATTGAGSTASTPVTTTPSTTTTTTTSTGGTQSTGSTGTSTGTSSTADTGGSGQSAANLLSALGTFMHDLFSMLRGNGGEGRPYGHAHGWHRRHDGEGGGLSGIAANLQKLIAALGASEQGGAAATAGGSLKGAALENLEKGFKALVTAMGGDPEQASLKDFLQALSQNLSGASMAGNLIETSA